ncbi:MAG TPA: 4-(cytidine 5'-diphospho)-2-C-methyl-D-erythritol kinase [Allosphingosinicella sp.]|nr:4-(cytidine 5'-diphospho)-2-C-methyl-D-erythritol kinase [Allosphingosinicella sp.]
MIHETAYAKLNLALHVRERLGDGYHRIETVFAFCEDGDVLIGRESDRLTLDLTGPFARELAAEPDNLVLRAAAMVGARVAFSLDKKLPLAAGLGGGSADAAAALRLIARMRGLVYEDVFGFAAPLGADVPACFFSQAARGAGRGDALTPLDEDLAGTPVLLVNPRRPLSTAAVFGGWDGTDRGPLGDWRDGRNDLEASAVALAPEISEVLGALSGAAFARMSGSGATCFGLFETEAGRDRAAAEIGAAQPGWWLSQTRLR